ncbi:MAG: ribosome silencing factor [Candidatus Shikimatogenerans bostrichidophilus]|nr:MAG: ribosome silencing factor [Candidatus Shikimatogenerans bostrichidophilus]
MKIYKKDYYFIKKIIKNINLIKGANIKVIDIRNKKNNLFNFFIICEGKSNLHVESIYNKIVESIYKIFKIKPYNIEGKINNKWVLIDYNFLIINIFLKKIRIYYNIDNMWKNYPIIDIFKKKIIYNYE